MAITKFSDITGLSLYISADPGENTINTSGTDVTSIVSTSADNGSAHPFTANDGGGVAKVQHDPATIKIGQMAAFQTTTSGSDAAIQCDFAQQTPMGDYTIVMVGQLDSNDTGSRMVEFTGYSGSTSNDIALETTAGPLGRIRVSNAIRDMDVGFNVGVGYVHVARWNNASGGTLIPEGWIDNVKSSALAAGTQHTGDTGWVTLLNRRSAISSPPGRIGLVAYYDRLLTDQEVTDIHDLARYWIDNGEAPSAGPPTTVTFGPVTTNDDPSVTEWNWEASADGGNNWDEAENVLSNVSGEATTSLVVNSATLAENGYQVRCRAISAKEPAGVESAVATLTVQAAS